MTRFELVKSMVSPEQMGKYFCYWHNECETCPKQHLCGTDGSKENGFVRYLKQEVRPDEPLQNTPIT